MTRPECPNCLKTVVTFDNEGDANNRPDSFCWSVNEWCRRPAEFNLSTAEIRDLRAGFAACWAEVERLRANLDMMHMDAVARHHGEKERTARLTRERDAALVRADKAEAELAAEREQAQRLRDAAATLRAVVERVKFLPGVQTAALAALRIADTLLGKDPDHG